MTEKVQIKICGRQRLGDECDETLMVAEGIYEKKKEAHRIEYEEIPEDGGKTIYNVIHASPRGVKIEKRGGVETDMFFIEGKTRGVSYRTPYGVLSMETVCEEIQIKESGNEIQIQIRYKLCAGGELISECETEIVIIK